MYLDISYDKLNTATISVKLSSKQEFNGPKNMYVITVLEIHSFLNHGHLTKIFYEKLTMHGMIFDSFKTIKVKKSK